MVFVTLTVEFKQWSTGRASRSWTKQAATKEAATAGVGGAEPFDSGAKQSQSSTPTPQIQVSQSPSSVQWSSGRSKQ